VGDTSESNSYAWAQLDGYTTWREDNSLYSIIDTGVPTIMISSVYYEALIKKIFASVSGASWQFDESDGTVVTSCEHEWPSLFFMFDGRWIEAAGKDYVYALDARRAECSFYILPANMAMNIIGMPVLLDYYTIHDPATGKIGFVPHTTSDKSDVLAGVPPSSQFLQMGTTSLAINPLALFISWFLCLGIVYGLIEVWRAFLRKAWQQVFSSTAFLAMSGGFFAAVVIITVFMVQPIIYDIVVIFG